ncbi:HNH endonuclease [Bacillus sp. MRMR6]|uniref:HNH endonuclease n=1 Tax=Bacillus sp. MRMR6 TaxID=1928617 RepID=UPI000950B7E1|nr:HNH endonuclease [Bacillus sp. MRMR6]OLS38590.1 hypothetical protein BTR25_14325 [Bacillus sp. MRMR6]
MVIFRGTAKVVTYLAGGAAKGVVKGAGKIISIKHKGAGDYFERVGKTTINSSIHAIETAAQVADGASKGIIGILTKNEALKQKGKADLKDSATRTVRGIGTTIRYGGQNIHLTLRGLKNQNKKELREGLKNLGEVVIVATTAVGVLDVLTPDNLVQASDIETRNDHLSGTEHSETSVLFLEKRIELPDGRTVDGVFPVFESNFNVVIVEELYLQNDSTHFQVANETLYQAIQEDPKIAKVIGLSHGDIHGLGMGITPEGYIWHHNEEPGVLQLVDRETHLNTGHTGGRELWGGGTSFR